jgi:hypothetical protein
LKGIIFNVFEHLVVRDRGEDDWDRLLSDSGLDGAYTSLGSYPDGDLMKLIEAASAAWKVPADEVDEVLCVRGSGHRRLALRG